ncbi:type IV secretion system protein [Nitrosospira sp. NRS527]|uniref:type IV secretion system protein n=1 Tax=Nitrosospira sp. NRS527 TaxID=155925 RepID=UPI001AF4A4A1|nr:type IV secretion system protein [Nitrosospira sp. NRS527]BCT69595.1 hypothetical protein NNRS527_03220 [Nitrosospira sp. NRS527]
MGRTGKTFIWVISSIALVSAGTARAQWTVTDPTSYGYYVQEIQKMTEQLQTAQDTLNGVKQVHSEMVGHYNRAAGLVAQMRDVEGLVRGTVGVLTQRGMALGYPKNSDGFIDISKVLDGTYGDGRSAAGRILMDGRHELQQAALKKVVLESEKLLDGIADRMKQASTIADQIDSTRNVKDATDLSNRLLVEILNTLIDMLAIASKSNQAQALFNYSGVTDSTIKIRQKKLAEQRNDLSGFLQKTQSSSGGILSQTSWQ